MIIRFTRSHGFIGSCRIARKDKVIILAVHDMNFSDRTPECNSWGQLWKIGQNSVSIKDRELKLSVAPLGPNSSLHSEFHPIRTIICGTCHSIPRPKSAVIVATIVLPRELRVIGFDEETQTELPIVLDSVFNAESESELRIRIWSDICMKLHISRFDRASACATLDFFSVDCRTVFCHWPAREFCDSCLWKPDKNIWDRIEVP